MNTYTLHHGDCRNVMASMEAESIDAIVCDPPYGLSFMGKEWDHGVPGVAFWTEALRVLKPGGHLLAFGGTRTYHRLAVAIEDAGFEIRDCLQWIYGSGFPKSHDVSKAIDKQAGAVREVMKKGKPMKSLGLMHDDKWQSDKEYNLTAPATDDAKAWQGWGTALKPSWEPIVMARKPLRGTVADNVLTYGTGALNIDGCRVGIYQTTTTIKDLSEAHGNQFGKSGIQYPKMGEKLNPPGRWPANTLLDEDAAAMLDAQSGGASRFFYVAKASPAERDAGLDGMCTVKYTIDRSILGGLSWNDVSTVTVQLLQKVTSELGMLKWLIGESGVSIAVLYPSDFSFITSMETSRIIALKICNSLMHSLTSESIADVNCEMESGSSHAKNVEQLKAWILNTTNEKMELALGAVNVALITLQQISESEPIKRNNFHSTVKPITLMRYLVRMVTPPDGVILDPFMGSGSTGCAATLEGFRFVGIDITEEYVAIAERRIAYWARQPKLL